MQLNRFTWTIISIGCGVLVSGIYHHINSCIITKLIMNREFVSIDPNLNRNGSASSPKCNLSIIINVMFWSPDHFRFTYHLFLGIIFISLLDFRIIVISSPNLCIKDNIVIVKVFTTCSSKVFTEHTTFFGYNPIFFLFLLKIFISRITPFCFCKRHNPVTVIAISDACIFYPCLNITILRIESVSQHFVDRYHIKAHLVLVIIINVFVKIEAIIITFRTLFLHRSRFGRELIQIGKCVT